jgi:hypothetical protein
VEDWGCGGGGFRRFCLSPRYIGLDGSKTPFADKIVDLCTYSLIAPGIMMRHILEHNYEWERILVSAVRSFQEKLSSDSIHALRLGNKRDRAQSQIRRFDVPAIAIHVEQRRTPQAVRELAPNGLQQLRIGGQPARHRFVFFEVARDKLGRFTARNMLAATRPAKAWPMQVSTGTPARSASLAVL